jgi:dipeptidyl aminopeptidase/acylaminoacyl peptidase
MTMKHATRVVTGAAVAAVGILVACSDTNAPAAPNMPEQIDAASHGVVVSNPLTTQSLASGRADGSTAAATISQEVSYVSLPPDRFQLGESAVITNLMSGASVTAPMRNGGFDPVPIPAAVGDTLEIGILNATGVVMISMVSKVPFRVLPTVVRTEPEKGKVDVVLNVAPIIVFSEPMDEQTVTDETIKLLLNGESIGGSVTLSGNRLRGKFTPSEPLALQTTYTLVITTGVTDRSGDPLQAPVEVKFTTHGAGVEPGPILFGRFIVELQRSEIWSVEPDGSNERWLAEGGGPAWSPDGSKIAFGRDGALYVMNAEGTGAVMVTNDGSGPAWSPDGSKIVFGRDGALYVMNADGTGAVMVTNDGGGPAWSPDGSKIAFVSDRDGLAGDIYVMNADGSNVERLTYAGGWVPAWSPDGSSIAFAGRAGNQGEVFVMNADGTGAVNLTNDPAPDWWPAWSPDGTKIVFSSGRRTPVPGDPPYDLYVMNADGSGLVRITTSNTLDWYADWRP